jgi:hypothetical protein
MNKITISISVTALLLMGCNDNAKTSSTTTLSVKSASVEKTPLQQKAPESAPMKSHTATVLETMDAAGYTYVKVDENGKTYWIAGPQTANVTVGNSISYAQQMIMNDFTSKTLNRTFEYLMFASALVPSGRTAPVSESLPQKQMESISITKLADGYSVSELYAKKVDLKDKTVKLKAKVVKVSKGIMGKDWIHLQDGTGDDATNDIIATATTSNVEVGDIVTAQGVLKTDIDLGYGYFYSVLLEEGTFSN